MHWLYQLPLWTMALLVIGGVVGATLAGMAAIRPWVRARCGGDVEAINGYVSACGVIYAVLLAMIAVAAWENYTQFDERVEAEASVAGALFRNAEGLPPEVRGRVRTHVREYVRDTVERVWADMRTGRPVDPNLLQPADHLIPLVGELTHFKPSDAGEANVHRLLLDKLDELLTLRRQRITSSHVGLMPLLWWVVLIGAALNLALTVLVTTEDRRVNVLLTGSYAFFVGLMLFAIAALDHPTWGAVAVGPDAFEAVGSTMDRVMQAAGGGGGAVR